MEKKNLMRFFVLFLMLSISFLFFNVEDVYAGGSGELRKFWKDIVDDFTTLFEQGRNAERTFFFTSILIVIVLIYGALLQVFKNNKPMAGTLAVLLGFLVASVSIKGLRNIFKSFSSFTTLVGQVVGPVIYIGAVIGLVILVYYIQKAVAKYGTPWAEFIRYLLIAGGLVLFWVIFNAAQNQFPILRRDNIINTVLWFLGLAIILYYYGFSQAAIGGRKSRKDPLQIFKSLVRDRENGIQQVFNKLEKQVKDNLSGGTTDLTKSELKIKVNELLKNLKKITKDIDDAVGNQNKFSSKIEMVFTTDLGWFERNERRIFHTRSDLLLNHPKVVDKGLFGYFDSKGQTDEVKGTLESFKDNLEQKKSLIETESVTNTPNIAGWIAELSQ